MDPLFQNCEYKSDYHQNHPLFRMTCHTPLKSLYFSLCGHIEEEIQGLIFSKLCRFWTAISSNHIR